MGVAAALLTAHGIRVYSEEDLTQALLEQLLREDAAARRPS